MTECLFCQTDRPDLNQIIRQNKTCYTRSDNYPAADGHVEIVPRRHVESFFDLTETELQDAYALLRAAQQDITEAHRPDGFTIGINEGRAAGRTIDHLHIHLIPRRHGDVDDPRGGVRRVLPDCDPDRWTGGQPAPERPLRRFLAAFTHSGPGYQPHDTITRLRSGRDEMHQHMRAYEADYNTAANENARLRAAITRARGIADLIEIGIPRNHADTAARLRDALNTNQEQP